MDHIMAKYNKVSYASNFIRILDNTGPVGFAKFALKNNLPVNYPQW
jgi:hypothetical protein